MLKKIYALFAAGLLLSACSEDVMDRINKNVNDPTQVASRYTLTDVMTSSAFSVTGSDLSFYASAYIEHNVGIYNQLYNAEIRNSGPYASSTYNNEWSNIYANLYALKGVITRCSEGGAEAGNTANLGIAQVLSAYNLAILTDCFGDVPWTEALQPGVIFQPKLDKQQDIYAAIFKLIDDGIANLGKATTFAGIGAQDLIYGGDKAKWVKAANALKARYLMRLSLRTPNYDGVITAINAAFSSAAEELKFSKYDGSIAISPGYAYFTDRDYFGASQSVHDKLVARSDPRDAIFFAKYPGASSLLFAPNGTPEQKQGIYGVNAFNYRATSAGSDEVSTANKKRPTYMISYHELLFLKAEAYARKAPQDLVNAEASLKAAIAAAFVKDGLTAAQADAYYTANVKALFDADPLKEIAMQKYLAFYQSESLEAYNDYRRLAAQGVSIPLANTKPFPQRFTYGSDDVTTNPKVKEAYGNGQYVKTEKVWWAGGTR
jgi:hypothetical protein